MKDFANQMDNVKVTIVNEPRVFISWENTEKGRDKTDCYERIDDNGNVYYVNTNNVNVKTYNHEKMFIILEKKYNENI